MCDDYKKHKSAIAAGLKDAGERWALATYRETVKTTSAVECEDVGEMMDENAFVAHAQTAEGGHLSVAQAKAKWDEMASNPEDCGTMYTRRDGKLRFRIHKALMVNFKSTFSHEQYLELMGKSVKKPEAGTIEAMRNKAMQGHGSIGDVDVGIESRAQGMLDAASGSASNCFRESDMLLPDVKRLGLQPKEEAEAEQEEEKTEDQEPQEGKREKWWDRDKAIANATRTASEKLKVARASVETTVKNANKALAELTTMGVGHRQSLRTEELILKNRIHPLQLVLGHNPQLLTDYIQSFVAIDGVAASATTPASDSSLGGKPAKYQIGSAPPCSDYRELVLLESLDSYIAKLFLAENAQQIKDLTKELNAKIGPIRQLEKNVQASQKEIQLRRKALRDQGEPARGVRKKMGVDTLIPVIAALDSIERDLGLDAISTLAKAEKDGIPYRVDGLAEHVKSIDAQNSLTSFHQDYKANFVDCGKAGRAMLTIEPTALAQNLMQKLQPCFEGFDGIVGAKTTGPAVLPQGMQDCMELKWFAVTPHYETTQCEKNYFGSLRLSLKGSRVVVLANLLLFRDYLLSKTPQPSGLAGIAARKSLGTNQIYNAFRNLTKEGVEEYALFGGKIFMSTIGEGEAVWVPEGWLFLERVSANLLLGMKVGVLRRKSVSSLKPLVDFSNEQDKPAQGISKAIDVL